MIISKLNNLTKENIDQLLKIWQDSVTKSHNFLTKSDIKEIKETLPEIFKKLEHIIVVTKEDSKNKIIGFIGLLEDKIEMIFLQPAFFKQGLGKKLVTHALQHYNIKYVDVNEQNKNAADFYHHLSFKTFKISDTDSQGRPFPILHLKYTK